MPPLDDYIMTDGNTAGALGAIYGGFQFCAWYPITPASSLAESLVVFAPRLRKDPDTKKNNLLLFRRKMNLQQLVWLLVLVGQGYERCLPHLVLASV
jgi:2-oxoglutarate/2-oxoacid ferredoxin oxidoreductase subunit alpha